MRITKSIAGFNEVNNRIQEHFELKVVAPAMEADRIAKCKKEVEKLIEGIDREASEREKNSGH